ncbi:MAG TPA: 16S rRNA (adenine(1518)-N(6)/adenine(1519)-N(6))-dimethyltransferase RsmA [Terriglobia bacterium]|nr:16S rRNA (adenine(1518)-N(6)/adenine(1519)-N(6))-dimethyltransferase RsmA [Terriglobia bacterium]
MMKRHRPKLGQHFLSDNRYCSRIADALELNAGDFVIEVGPGHGAVTGLLASRAQSVIAIEIDPALADELRQKFLQSPNVEIVHGDVLLTDVGDICRRQGAEQCYVFGNLPYYITSPIIHHVLGSAKRVRAMGLLVQREVADRLVAQPGSRDYGYLTVFTRFYSSARLVFDVPPGAFTPPPKVHSAFVRFEVHAGRRGISPENEEKFLRFLKQAFAFKRKKLLNCLVPMYSRQEIEAELERLAVPFSIRAEELSIEQFISIFLSVRHGMKAR